VDEISANASETNQVDTLVENLLRTPDMSFDIISKIRSANIEDFRQAAPKLLSTRSSNVSLWRLLSLHFMRDECFAECQEAAERHLALIPGSDEAMPRIARAALLSANEAKTQDSIRLLSAESSNFGGISYAAQCAARFINNQELEAIGAKARIEFLIATLADVTRFDSNLDSEESKVVFGSTRENLVKLLTVLGQIIRAKDIAIVGNSGNLLSQGKGEEIDSADLVIRFNFPAVKGFEQHVGARTDLVVFTEAYLDEGNWSSMLKKAEPFGGVPKLAINASPRSEVFKAQAHGHIPDGLIITPNEIRSAIRDSTYVFATTGLCTICLLAFVTNARLKLYGFDFYRNTAAMNYFEVQKEPFLGHELAYEAWYVTEFLPLLLPGRICI
jgi:hypothetical protein